MGVIAETADRIAVMYAGRLVEIGPARAVLRAPVHPYTRGLMSSIPNMKRRNADLPQIDGSMPRLSDIPAGCAFHPRCPVRVARCFRERPALSAAGDTAAACWLTSAGQSGGGRGQARGRP
jgi:peptide/nickel transport system ATP-binding protein